MFPKSLFKSCTSSLQSSGLPSYTTFQWQVGYYVFFLRDIDNFKALFTLLRSVLSEGLTGRKVEGPLDLSSCFSVTVFRLMTEVENTVMIFLGSGILTTCLKVSMASVY